MTDHLPPLDQSNSVRLDVLMELHFKQLMTFSDYLNTSSNKIPNWKFAEFVIYALGERLKEEKEIQGWK